jgi:hypothetical protein
MLPASLPFDYLILLDSSDRVRRPVGRPTGSRVRRTGTRERG